MLIVNAVIVSPEREAPLPNAWVRVNDGRITDVGVGRPDTVGAHVIDAAGRYLTPGLIDSHVHLYHATGLKRRYTQDFDALYAAFMEQQPRSFLYFGFTTVIELNADFDTNARFEAAPVRPRLVHCGQGVILSDGFMALELPEGKVGDYYPGYLLDSRAGATAIAGDDPAEHTPEAVVTYVQASGGRCIKLYYEEALWWPDDEPPLFRLPSAEIIRDVVDAAHARRLPVLLHATTPDGHRLAMNAGVDILAHGMWEWPGQAFDAPAPLPEYAALALALARSGIALQPTYGSIRNTASLFDASVLQDPNWENVAPAAYLGYLRGEAQAQKGAFLSTFGKALGGDLSDRRMAALQAAFFKRYQRLIGQMAENGAVLLFGSDTAVGGFGWASPPGLAGFWEIQSLEGSGVSRGDIFKALTISNAQAFGLDHDLGTIEPGKFADMLLLNRSPLDTTDAYNDIAYVIVNGEVLSRNELSARAAKFSPADAQDQIDP